MSKPTHEQLVEATARYLPAYIGRGISVNPVIESLDPELNITNLTALLECRFLISGRVIETAAVSSRVDVFLNKTNTGGILDHTGTPVGVLDFMSLLGPRLRSVEPAVQKELNIRRGEVDGPIDWPQTVKHRYQSGDEVGSTYAVRSQKRTVQTTPNRVLVRLLQVIKTLVEQLDRQFEVDFDGHSSFTSWRPEGSVRMILREAFEHPSLKEVFRSSVTVTERDISDVLVDRRPLYREAATLLRAIRDIRNSKITDEQAQDLFRMEIFAPSPEDGTADLFELYWIFQLLEQFDRPRFNQITNSRGQLIAQWESDTSEYLLFNDWRGDHRWDDEREYQDYLEITFDVPDSHLNEWIKNDSNQFIRRHLATTHTKYEIYDSVFDYSPQRKAPDIVLLKIDPQTNPATLEQLFIGEVKHSTSRTTVLNGVQQLLEYGAHAKLGPHLQVERDGDTEYIATTENSLNAPELEMGYFIGDANQIESRGPESLQIRGFGDSAKHPFEN